MATLTRMVWVAAASVTLVACASAPAEQAAPETAAATTSIIEVENNLSSFADVTVFVEPQNGVRRSLGTVRSGSSSTFNVTESGVLQFVAQGTTGNNLTSERINANSPSRIRWVLTTNRITMRSR